MSDRILETITAALSKHYLWDADSEETIARCRCDVDNPSITNGVEDGGWMPFTDHPKHVTEVVVAALKSQRIQLVEVGEELSSEGPQCGICYGEMIDDPTSKDDGCCSWCGASSWWLEGVGVDSRVIRELKGYLIHAREGKLPGQSAAEEEK